MYKLALLGLAAGAILGVSSGVHADVSASTRSHGIVALDTGWGDPCSSRLPGEPPQPCGSDPIGGHH
jgi:hypothetical protein